MENIKVNQQTQPKPSSARVYSDAVCRLCGAIGPECGFYKNDRMKAGHLSVCANCHSARTVAQRKERRDPNYIDGRKQRPKMSEEDRLRRNREKSLLYYHNNIEKVRERGREYAKKRHAADPGLKRRAMLKSKYSLTPDGWQAMFEAQGCRCAICGSDRPNAKAGWNTDHCHKSGKVRFILCAHCNRGLGAFRDNPEWMRKAADMIEAINDQPVEAIHG